MLFDVLIVLVQVQPDVEPESSRQLPTMPSCYHEEGRSAVRHERANRPLRPPVVLIGIERRSIEEFIEHAEPV